MLLNYTNLPKELLQKPVPNRVTMALWVLYKSVNPYPLTAACRLTGLHWYPWVTSTSCCFSCLSGIRKSPRAEGGRQTKQASDYILSGFFSVCDSEDPGATPKAECMVFRACSSNNTLTTLPTLVGRACSGCGYRSQRANQFTEQRGAQTESSAVVKIRIQIVCGEDADMMQLETHLNAREKER